MQTNASTSAVSALFPPAAAASPAPAGFGDLLAALTQAKPAAPAAPGRPAADVPGVAAGEDKPAAAGEGDPLSLLAPVAPPQGTPILVPLPVQVPPPATAFEPSAGTMRPPAVVEASAMAGIADSETPAEAFVPLAADHAGVVSADVATQTQLAAPLPSTAKAATPAATVEAELPAPAMAEPRKLARRVGKEATPSAPEADAAASPLPGGGAPPAERPADRGPAPAAVVVAAPQALPADAPADTGLRLDASGIGSAAPHLYRASAEPVSIEPSAVPPPSPPVAMPPTAQIAVQVARGSVGETIVVSLKPAELGAVEVSLELGSDGRMSAHVAVERPETLELVQRDAPQLERALREAGIDLASDALTFDLRQDGQSSAQQRAPQAWPGRRQAFDGHPGPEAEAGVPRVAQHRSLRLLDLSI